MTKIRMLQQMSGYRNGVPWPAVGDLMEVEEAEAALLTQGQTPIAKYHEEAAEEERAVAPEPEAPEETATATRTPAATRTRSTTAKK